MLVIIILAAYAWYVEGHHDAQLPDSQTRVSQGHNAQIIEKAASNGDSMWLLFRSGSCAPCIEMKKVFDLLQPEYTGKVRFISIDVDDEDNAALVKKYQIRYIPTTYIINCKGTVSYHQVGIVSEDELKKELNKVVKP